VSSSDELSGPIHVVIADDHPAFRHALQRVIDAERDMTVVAAVGDGAAALDVIRRLAPEIAVLDVRMPGLDGIEVARQLVDDRLGARAVIVTMHSERVMFERAIAAGVCGYVLKDTALSEVVQAVRTVARGHTYITPALSAGFGRET
jgi:DNA-binding NarL/FixJ family response regulator